MRIRRAEIYTPITTKSSTVSCRHDWNEPVMGAVWKEFAALCVTQQKSSHGVFFCAREARTGEAAEPLAVCGNGPGSSAACFHGNVKRRSSMLSHDFLPVIPH